MAEKLFEIDVGGVPMKFNRKGLEAIVAAGEYFNEHSMALGELCAGFAALDWAVDRLFQPLLQCSEAQVACILVENISTRCGSLKKLVILESLPEPFTDWIDGLLSRASGELAELRNRYIHDSWKLSSGTDGQSANRIDKRAKLGKPQSRQPKTIIYNTLHATEAAEVRRLTACMGTVTRALAIAASNLEIWRSTGQLPELDQRWLPACKARARGRFDVWCLEEFAQPPPPSAYEFD